MANDEAKLEKLFWLDMEMTGLDPQACKIIEVACVVTDLDLNVLDQYQRVVFQPKEFLDRMDEWCTKTHGESGLTQAVATGTHQYDVEKEMIEFLKKHFPKGKAILAGNSIWQDRRFVEAHLPEFSKQLHYRMIDVSSYKEIFKNRFKIQFKKKECHRASEDIHESIAELRHYLGFFNPNQEA